MNYDELSEFTFILPLTFIFSYEQPSFESILPLPGASAYPRGALIFNSTLAGLF